MFTGTDTRTGWFDLFLRDAADRIKSADGVFEKIWNAEQMAVVKAIGKASAKLLEQIDDTTKRIEQKIDRAPNEVANLINELLEGTPRRSVNSKDVAADQEEPTDPSFFSQRSLSIGQRNNILVREGQRIEFSSTFLSSFSKKATNRSVLSEIFLLTEDELDGETTWGGLIFVIVLGKTVKNIRLWPSETDDDLFTFETEIINNMRSRLLSFLALSSIIDQSEIGYKISQSAWQELVWSSFDAISSMGGEFRVSRDCSFSFFWKMCNKITSHLRAAETKCIGNYTPIVAIIFFALCLETGVYNNLCSGMLSIFDVED